MVRLTHVLRLHRTEVRRLAFWNLKGREDWRRRLALTYAVSVWSMIGLVAFMQWRQKKDPVESEKTEPLSDLEEDLSQGRKQKIVFSASVEYKENSVPYTTRIYQYFTSTKKTSDSGSAEN